MAKYSKRGGYLLMHAQLLNGKLFNRLLKQAEGAVYTAEQGKILSNLWERCPMTATDLALNTGLANNTLTIMLDRLERQGLIRRESHPTDKRKKLYYLTETGQNQEKIGEKVSRDLSDIFYRGFSDEEQAELEDYLTRILDNLQAEYQKGKWK